jgi:hypothetical protein
MMARRCACGRALHYLRPAWQDYVERSIAACGPTVAVATPNGTWLVDKHFYALHGISLATLPQLAAVFHWPRVP